MILDINVQKKKEVPINKRFVFLIETVNVQIFLIIDIYCFSFM